MPQFQLCPAEGGNLAKKLTGGVFVDDPTIRTDGCLGWICESKAKLLPGRDFS